MLQTIALQECMVKNKDYYKDFIGPQDGDSGRSQQLSDECICSASGCSKMMTTTTIHEACHDATHNICLPILDFIALHMCTDRVHLLICRGGGRGGRREEE